MTNKVFVTGAAGWLGVNLIRILVQGKGDLPASAIPKPSQIKAMFHPNDNTETLYEFSSSVEMFKGDITSKESCKEFLRNGQDGILIHCAGIIHPRTVSQFYSVNVEGTRNLVKSAIENKIKRIIVVSSNSPTGVVKDNGIIFDENSPYNPYMNYGKSKMNMEKMVIDESSGRIEFCIVRAPWFYGPYQPERQTLFFKMLRDGKFPLVGDGTNLRSMAYTDNLSQGLLLAGFNKNVPSSIYWIADEKPYSMMEIISTIKYLLKNEFGIKVEERLLRIPGFIGDVATIADSAIQSLGLYHQKIHVLSEMNKTIACNIEKAKIELGYEPLVGLSQGMRKSIAWCISRGYLK